MVNFKRSLKRADLSANLNKHIVYIAIDAFYSLPSVILVAVHVYGTTISADSDCRSLFLAIRLLLFSYVFKTR